MPDKGKSTVAVDPWIKQNQEWLLQKEQEDQANRDKLQNYLKNALQFNPQATNYSMNVTGNNELHMPEFQHATNLPNSLVIGAHGSEEKAEDLFHSGDGSDNTFSIRDVAKAIGPQTNSIQNLVNLACYGANVDFSSAQKYFPNLQHYVSSPTNSNIIGDRVKLLDADYKDTNDPSFIRDIFVGNPDATAQWKDTTPTSTNSITNFPSNLHPETMDLWRQMHGITNN